MKSKTIGGVKFKLRTFGGDLRLEITAGDGVTHVMPARRSLELHHLQELEAWIKQAQEEIENGR